MPTTVKHHEQISAASAYFSSDDEDPNQLYDVPAQIVDQMIHDLSEKDNELFRESQNDQISSNKIAEIRVNQRGSTPVPVPVPASTNLLPISNEYDNVVQVANGNSERLYTINEAKHYLSFQNQQNLRGRKPRKKNNSKQLAIGGGGSSSGEEKNSSPAVFHFSIEYIRKQFTRTKKKIGWLNQDKKIHGQILVMIITLLYLTWTICSQSSMINEQSIELQRTKEEVEILQEKVKTLSKILDSYDRLVGLELLIRDKSHQIRKLEERVTHLEVNMTEFASKLRPAAAVEKEDGGEESLWKWNILGGGGNGGSAIEAEENVESDLNLINQNQDQNRAVDSFQRSVHQMKHNFPHQTKETWIQILSQIIPSLENFPNSRPSVLSVLSPPEMPSQFAHCFVRKLANAINLAQGEGHNQQQQDTSSTPKILNGQKYFEEMGDGSVITKCHQDLKEYLDPSNEQWGKAIVVNQISEISKEDYLMVFQAFCDNGAALDTRASFLFLIEIPREFYYPDKWNHWNGKQILHDFLHYSWKNVLTNDKRAALLSRIAPATILLQTGDNCNI